MVPILAQTRAGCRPRFGSSSDRLEYAPCCSKRYSWQPWSWLPLRFRRRAHFMRRRRDAAVIEAKARAACCFGAAPSQLKTASPRRCAHISRRPTQQSCSCGSGTIQARRQCCKGATSKRCFKLCSPRRLVRTKQRCPRRRRRRLVRGRRLRLLQLLLEHCLGHRPLGCRLARFLSASCRLATRSSRLPRRQLACRLWDLLYHLCWLLGRKPTTTATARQLQNGSDKSLTSIAKNKSQRVTRGGSCVH